MCYEYLHDYKCLFNEMKKKMFIYGTWGHLEVVKFVFENTNCTVLQNWKINAINKENYCISC